MLSKEEILKRTNKGLDVFRHYIPFKFRLGRNFLNPLYPDRRPSCNIYFDKYNDIYKIKDFGNEDYSGDCFHFVGKMYNLDCQNNKNFIEILNIIDRDVNYGTSMFNDINPIPVPNNEVKYIPYTKHIKAYSSEELEFWARSGINLQTLNKYHVESIKQFDSVNKEGKSYSIYGHKKEPVFCYNLSNIIKIYRPFSEIRFQYAGKINESYCFGLEQLPLSGDIVFITGGERDVLTLASHSFHAICFNSETSKPNESFIKRLSRRFKHLILLYDCDETGLESSLKHQKEFTFYNLKRIVLPLSGAKNQKDITDYFIMGKTRDDFKSLLLSMIDSIYTDTLSILKPLEVDFGNPPDKAQIIISVQNVPLGVSGNLLGITGGEGTGKSNYVCSIISGAISEFKDIDTLGLTLSKSLNKAVILYDTEQSQEHLYKNINTCLKRAKIQNKPDFLHAYSLNVLNRKERIQSIVESMDRNYYLHGGIHLVIIDGIADLIRTTNDEIESIELIDELYRLAGIYNTCIVAVLHFIPQGMKLRGHLGSELHRKAASILSIENDHYKPGISVAKAIKVRDGSPLDVPLIEFGWNRELGMHTYIGEKTKKEKEDRKVNELKTLARLIFSFQSHLTYSELSVQIQKSMDVKDRTSKNYIKFMYENNIIHKDDNSEKYYLNTVTK